MNRKTQLIHLNSMVNLNKLSPFEILPCSCEVSPPRKLHKQTKECSPCTGSTCVWRKKVPTKNWKALHLLWLFVFTTFIIWYNRLFNVASMIERWRSFSIFEFKLDLRLHQLWAKKRKKKRKEKTLIPLIN